jgi:hypothetical protein
MQIEFDAVAARRDHDPLDHRSDRLHRLEPHRLVFINDTSINTRMVRLRGRSPCGKRLRASALFGHWGAQSFIAGLRCHGLTAPWNINFAKLKAHLQSAAARTFDALWKAVGNICDLVTPNECRNLFTHAGYAPDQSSDALALRVFGQSARKAPAGPFSAG